METETASVGRNGLRPLMTHSVMSNFEFEFSQLDNDNTGGGKLDLLLLLVRCLSLFNKHSLKLKFMPFHSR